jgi:hypothetical protein
METVAKLSPPKSSLSQEPITYIDNKELTIVATYSTYFNILYHTALICGH